MPKKIMKDLETLETDENEKDKIRIKSLKDLETLETLVESDESEEEEIEIKPRKIDKRKTNVRSEKQIEAFSKVQQLRQIKRDERDNERLIKEEEQQKLKEEQKKLLEAKIIKKAISIRKKEIKRQIVLDEISDDDEPIELIKDKILKSNIKKSIKKQPEIIQPIKEEHNNYTIRFI